jgi:hypothetical protein
MKRSAGYRAPKYHILRTAFKGRAWRVQSQNLFAARNPSISRGSMRTEEGRNAQETPICELRGSKNNIPYNNLLEDLLDRVSHDSFSSVSVSLTACTPQGPGVLFADREGKPRPTSFPPFAESCTLYLCTCHRLCEIHLFQSHLLTTFPYARLHICFSSFPSLLLCLCP